ncbi:MAG: carbohydrate ABC transporter permease [Caldicoprobacterales bacterium]|jgi:ABC-type sugar transport system permease subunit
MKKRWRMSMNTRKILDGYIFISPWLIGCFLFFLNPLLKSIQLSFSKLAGTTGFQLEWAGWTNYMKAFVLDVTFIPMFLEVVRNMFVNTPLIIVFSLFIAILINKNIRMRWLFREVFFFPVLLGTGYVMQQLLGYNVDAQTMEVARGILLPQEMLVYLGPRVSDMVQLFMDRITIILWKSGVQIILFLSGLQGISPSLYEAARCDSATEWEMFWKITLPMISPVILLNIIYTIIDSFTDSMNPILDFIHTTAFVNRQMEYAAAIGWIYFVFIFLVVGLVFLVMRRYIYHTNVSAVSAKKGA